MHVNGKKLLASNHLQDRKITDMLKKYDAEKHPVGENLPDEVRVFRIKVVKCFLKPGVPLAKVYCFQELFEENAFRRALTVANNLYQLIPFIHEEEHTSIKSDINAKNGSVIFDGTTECL